MIGVCGLLGSRKSDVGDQGGIDEGLPIEEFPSRHVDPQRQLEAEDGLAQGRVDSFPYLFWRFPAQSSPCPIVRVPAQTIDRLLLAR